MPGEVYRENSSYDAQGYQPFTTYTSTYLILFKSHKFLSFFREIIILSKSKLYVLKYNHQLDQQQKNVLYVHITDTLFKVLY